MYKKELSLTALETWTRSISGKQSVFCHTWYKYGQQRVNIKWNLCLIKVYNTGSTTFSL